jgi:hypothetical protein
MDDTRRSERREFQRGMLMSGLAGLAACWLLAVLCTGLVVGGTFPTLLPYLPVTLALVIILGIFSLAEIPMMIYALRQLAIERKSNHRPVQILNIVFVFFAGVYAAPVTLLTGSIGWGLALFTLSLVRFASSLIFVRLPDQIPDND